MNELQTIKKKSFNIKLYQEPKLFEEVLIFVGKMNILCNFQTSESILEAIASELTEYLITEENSKYDTLENVFNAMKKEIYKKEIFRFSINTFIVAFNVYLENKQNSQKNLPYSHEL